MKNLPNPLTQIPAKYRMILYYAAFLVGVFLGACQVAGVVSLFGAELGTVWNVYAYVGIALGLTAGSNVTPQDRPRPAPKSNPLNDAPADRAPARRYSDGGRIE